MRARKRLLQDTYALMQVGRPALALFVCSVCPCGLSAICEPVALLALREYGVPLLLQILADISDAKAFIEQMTLTMKSSQLGPDLDTATSLFDQQGLDETSITGRRKALEASLTKAEASFRASQNSALTTLEGRRADVLSAFDELDALTAKRHAQLKESVELQQVCSRVFSLR